jgi:hypothetical protein
MKKSHVVVYSALLLLLGSACSQAQQSLTSTGTGDANAGSLALSNASGMGIQRMLPHCSGQASRLPESIARACKPGLASKQTQQLSNDLRRNLPREDYKAVYVEFVVPGFTNPSPLAINLSGAVTGVDFDTNGGFHGFVRSPLGTVTTFDGPDAACSPQSQSDVCAWPVGINLQGSITGFYCDAVTCHGFLRTPGGTITAFDPPGSVFTVFNTGGINLAGVVAGSYYDVNFLGHGFLRSPGGTFTVFNAPGAVNGTFPTGINDAGEVVGEYYDTNFGTHGFLRAPDGTITTVDPTGSIYTSPTAINLEGAVTGQWQDPRLGIHGFLRSSDGTLTTFDVPDSDEPEPSAIDPAGTIAGSFYDTSGDLHGFVRASDGTFTAFDPPGSEGTSASAINAAGVITGAYTDSNSIGHGYLRMPTQ